VFTSEGTLGLREREPGDERKRKKDTEKKVEKRVRGKKDGGFVTKRTALIRKGCTGGDKEGGKNRG